eukprot:6709800-Prymnesium_polylepis.1
MLSLKKLKADRDVVLAAVKQNSEALFHASEELQADREVVLTAQQLASAGHRACDVLDGPEPVPDASRVRSAFERSARPRRSDEALLAALQMPIASKRVTLGDAYAHVGVTVRVDAVDYGRCFQDLARDVARWCRSS